MESKEAVYIVDKFGIELPIGSAAEIVNLILELQKYKDMFEALEEMFKPGKWFNIPEDKNFEEHARKITDLKYIIDELKERFFPKPEPKSGFEKTIELFIEELMQSIKVFLEDHYGIKAEKETKKNKKGGKSTC